MTWMIWRKRVTDRKMSVDHSMIPQMHSWNMQTTIHRANIHLKCLKEPKIRLSILLDLAHCTKLHDFEKVMRNTDHINVEIMYPETPRVFQTLLEGNSAVDSFKNSDISYFARFCRQLVVWGWYIFIFSKLITPWTGKSSNVLRIWRTESSRRKLTQCYSSGPPYANKLSLSPLRAVYSYPFGRRPWRGRFIRLWLPSSFIS